MRKSDLIERREIGLYPKWETSTHDVLHIKLIEELGLTPVSYYDMYRYLTLTRVRKLRIKLLTFAKFIQFNFQRQSRKSLRYKGVIISHPIIEIHIRRNKIGKFSFTSKHTFDLVYDAICFIEGYRAMQRKFEVAVIIGGDEAYLEGSIVGQLAAMHGIKHLFLKQAFNVVAGFKFDTNTLYAGPDFKQYQKFFSTLNLDRGEMRKYENELHDVVVGKANYSYVRNQTIASCLLSEEELEVLKDSIILFLHDFIDSPGLYGECTFHDQWRWIEESIKVTAKNKCKLVIKIHPNYHVNNEPALQLLKKIYNSHKNIFFFDKKVSLSHLKQAGIKGILTLFGSVIVEAAYLGIRCISAANNPFISFSINTNVNTASQFRSELSKLCREQFPFKHPDKAQVLSAYITPRLFYQHCYLIKDFPYNDVSVSLFQSMYSHIPNASTFGINERRDIFLHDEKMAEYVKKRTKDEEALIIERFNLLNNTM